MHITQSHGKMIARDELEDTRADLLGEPSLLELLNVLIKAVTSLLKNGLVCVAVQLLLMPEKIGHLSAG